MRKVILLFLLFLSVAGVRTQGQNITFSHLTTDDGLSQFSVNSLYIDERGIIWIGTREGLNRYNGNDIKSFKLNKNDPNSLFSNTVLRITGNKNGKVYLLCTDGVAEFDLTTQRFKTLLQGNVDAIYFNEKLYIGKREEVFVYNESTGNFDLYYHLAEKISPSPASTWTKRKICGWELPVTDFTVYRETKKFPNLSQEVISRVFTKIRLKNYGSVPGKKDSTG